MLARSLFPNRNPTIMNKLTPLIKGLITGILMVAWSLWLYYKNVPLSTGLQYSVYIIYGAGIIWTLVAHYLAADFSIRFAGLFIQGFRCFIIVTLVMVIYYGVFNTMHPEFAKESARLYETELKKDGNTTPAEQQDKVARYKKQYTTRLVSSAIFGYLIVGAAFTLITAVILLLISFIIRRR